MKRLIYLISLIIYAVILYTCKSPVGIDATTIPNGVGDYYYSSMPIISQSGSTYLGVNVSLNTATPSITIGFANTNSGTNIAGDPISSTGNTNIISGTYPNISFQNGVLSGTITFFDTNQLKITFQQNNSPYFKMQDVICKK